MKKKKFYYVSLMVGVSVKKISLMQSKKANTKNFDILKKI